MASVFSHVAVPVAMTMAVGRKVISGRLLVLAMILSAAPDLDTVGLQFGIPYDSPWGHRGFTHSVFFALIFAILPTMFYRSLKASRTAVYLTTSFAMISHGFLDACTTGGRGVALLWPLNSERSFFPWQVIEVSPLSVGRFFTEKGMSVLSSELYYVWLPCLAVGMGFFLLRWVQKKLSRGRSGPTE